MIRRPGRRWGWAPAWALLLLAFAPAWAEAQLFPRAPIRRERPPCDHESPVFKMYRHEFYGYHPTCWRPFPQGWGCPSPEAPNAALEFQRRKRDEPIPLDGGEDFEEPMGAEPDPAAPGVPQPGGMALPPLPRGDRSPFELDAPAPPAGGAVPPARRDPFEPDPNRGTPPAGPLNNPLDNPANPFQPSGRPGGSAGLAPESSPMELPELPDPSNPLARGATLEPMPGSLPMIVEAGEPIGRMAPPAEQAPQRRTLLGGLFGRRLRR